MAFFLTQTAHAPRETNWLPQRPASGNEKELSSGFLNACKAVPHARANPMLPARSRHGAAPLQGRRQGQDSVGLWHGLPASPQTARSCWQQPYCHQRTRLRPVSGLASLDASPSHFACAAVGQTPEETVAVCVLKSSAPQTRCTRTCSPLRGQSGPCWQMHGRCCNACMPAHPVPVYPWLPAIPAAHRHLKQDNTPRGA